MPTVYTADIKDGISFEEFVWTCARAFGALVMMRDDPMGAQIPECFEPSTYYATRVQEAEANLSRLHGLTKEQANAECLAEYRRAMESHNQRVAEKRGLREKYLRMLAKAKEWKPPTEEHVGLRDFMVQQITESIDWDCSTKYDTPPVCKSTKAWLADSIEQARQELIRAQQSHAEEVERTEGRNRWLKALRESVPPPVKPKSAALSSNIKEEKNG